MADFKPDRSTTIQSQAALLQQQADAIKATAQAVINIAENYYGEGIPQAEMGAVFAKLEGIIGTAMQMAGEAGLVIAADEYQQGRTRDLEHRAARQPFTAGDQALLGRGTYRLVGSAGGGLIVGAPRTVTVRDDEADDGSNIVVDSAGHAIIVGRGAIARVKEDAALPA
ncbi:MAG TPA: hypothetical protein VMW48_05215 [Vicinamibacterales bacterium]|nr:hypothetical protein [Vicinamibacterales bacterium]